MLSHFGVGAARSVVHRRGVIRSGIDMFVVGLGVVGSDTWWATWRKNLLDHEVQQTILHVNRLLTGFPSTDSARTRPASPGRRPPLRSLPRLNRHTRPNLAFTCTTTSDVAGAATFAS